jgi:hypothetical protein
MTFFRFLFCCLGPTSGTSFCCIPAHICYFFFEDLLDGYPVGGNGDGFLSNETYQSECEGVKVMLLRLARLPLTTHAANNFFWVSILDLKKNHPTACKTSSI